MGTSTLSMMDSGMLWIKWCFRMESWVSFITKILLLMVVDWCVHNKISSEFVKHYLMQRTRLHRRQDQFLEDLYTSNGFCTCVMPNKPILERQKPITRKQGGPTWSKVTDWLWNWIACIGKRGWKQMHQWKEKPIWKHQKCSWNCKHRRQSWISIIATMVNIILKYEISPASYHWGRGWLLGADL